MKLSQELIGILAVGVTLMGMVGAVFVSMGRMETRLRQVGAGTASWRSSGHLHRASRRNGSALHDGQPSCVRSSRRSSTTATGSCGKRGSLP